MTNVTGDQIRATTASTVMLFGKVFKN